MRASFDIDGVINMGDYPGIYPGVNDIIITGRSFEEEKYTLEYLYDKGIFNVVYFNSLKFDEKTRESSGHHKADTINRLNSENIDFIKIVNHYEDDPIQADIINKKCPDIKVILVCHDLVEKENVWHGKS